MEPVCVDDADCGEHEGCDRGLCIAEPIPCDKPIPSRAQPADVGTMSANPSASCSATMTSSASEPRDA